jgi:hypothetical protein
MQLLAPTYSNCNREEIELQMKNGQLFPTVRDRHSRRGIYQRAINIKGRIPSLLLFIEDTKYLEAPAKALKSLFPININKTL